MVRHGLKHIFQKPTPDIDSSDRTQQLRSKTVYAGTVNLAQTLAKGNNSLYKTYNGPYEVVTQSGKSNLIASRSYDDLLSITKGKVLLNQLPLTPFTQEYYQKNFAKGQMYEGNYNRFDPSFNFVTGCNNSVLVYDISTPGFAGPSSYDTNGGFIGVTGPGPTGTSDSNKHIFVDPDHCYYSDPCLLDASYTRFVSPGLTGATGSAQFTAQQIINADQYRGFIYPMPNLTLMCVQEIPDQQIGPLFCPKPPTPITSVIWEYTNSPPTDLINDITPTYNGSAFTLRVKSVVPANAKYKLSGVTSVTNADDPPAQITLTGSESFFGSIQSPSIRIVPASFTSSWEYTIDGGTSYTDLTGDVTAAYTASAFAIRLKGVVPVNATFTQSGVASVINVGDLAQITLTGSGNFTGSVTSPPIRVTPPEINIYSRTSGTITRSRTDTPNYNGDGNNLVLGYTNTVDTTGNYYVSSATNPSLTFDNTKPLYLHFFIPLPNPANPGNPNVQVWTQASYYYKGSATLTFVAADSKYVSTPDNNFVLQSGQTYWTIWSQYPAGSFIANVADTKLSMLIDDGGTGQWQWQGTLNVTKV